jgi:hypothetical protein
MELFSERNNLKVNLVAPDAMPEGLRNRLWNALEEAITHEYHRNDVIKKSWSDFFKKSVSDLHGTTSYR